MNLDGRNELLFETLVRACSQNPIEMKDAEMKLQQLEIQPGYCINLFKIISDYSLNVDLRCMAGVCLKNSIEKYWRKAAVNSLKEEERGLLKANFLSSLSEPELKIARQLAVIIGKIGRFDVPLQWQDIIPKLIHILQETTANLGLKDNNVVHNRSLMYLHQIIKSLSSKRLLNDRRIFEEINLSMIDLIINVAFSYIQRILASNFDQVSTELYCLDQTILLLKILDKLVVHGFKDNVANESLNRLMVSLISSFNELISKYKYRLATDDLKEKYEYILQTHVQILSNYQETYPYNFVNYLYGSLNLISNLCFTGNGKQLLFKQLCINLMNLLKSIVMCDKYKQTMLKINDQPSKEKQLKAIEIRKQYFNAENLKQIFSFMFEEYLVVSMEELELWLSDEEEFLNEDTLCADSWKYSFRACAETLFQAFVHEYSDGVIPIILEFLHQFNKSGQQQQVLPLQNLVEQLKNGQNLDYIRYVLLKDVAYNCASISAWELMHHIDFDNWLINSLLTEIKEPSCNDLIKRRILILIAHWVNIKLSRQYRPLIYELICSCLQSSQNLVVRLQATTTLRAVLDDVHFERDIYLPFINFHFGLLCQLLKEVKECDTKIKVLGVLSFIIERVDVYIRPYCSQLADYLPFLWQQSQEHNLLQVSIVTAFNHLVKSFGAESVKYHSFLIPILSYATDTNNPASVYLLEEGLALWIITVQNSLELSPELLQLFNNLKTLLDRDTDIWKLCLEIIDAYVVLDANLLFQYYSDFIITKFCDLLTESIKIEALLRLMTSIGHIFEIPKIQVSLFEPFIVKAINLALNPDIYPMIMAMCLNMLAKPVLDDCPEFLKVVEKFAVLRGISPEELLSNLLDSWIDKIDMIVHPEKRKLTALALTSLLRYKSNVVYERFGAIINVDVTVMLDVMKEENGVKYDCLVMSRAVEDDDEEIDTEHEKRKRRLRLCNPIYSISMKDFCVEMLRECEVVNGSDKFQNLVSNVDKHVMQKLRELLN